MLDPEDDVFDTKRTIGHDVDETGVWEISSTPDMSGTFFLPLQLAHDLRGIKVVFLLLCQ